MSAYFNLGGSGRGHAGESYESWKAQQLQRRGFAVDHRGATGQPDIIATGPEAGMVRVFSCKCLSFDRRTTLPVSEIAPEVHEARRIGAALVLSVFNLADSTEQEIVLDRDKLPKRIPISKLNGD